MKIKIINNQQDMKRLQTLLITIAMLTLPIIAKAQYWDDAKYKQIENNIKAPTFPDKNFVITKYGAKTNATAAKNQKAINKAIAACSKAGGGKVIVPEGTWNTGAITLQSNVNLVVEKGATLLFAFEKELYPIVRTRWEGMDCMNYQPCVYANKANNVAISGEGTIDGNGRWETWWPMCNKGKLKGDETIAESQRIGRPLLFEYAEAAKPIEERNMKGGGLRPQLINFVECEGVLIEGVTMLRSPFWVIHPLLSKNITVRNVKIWNEGPNGDGCDPESCENVLIEDCYFHTGDDCIAIKSGRNADGLRWNIPSKNIIVRNCKMEDGHGGVVIGSEISGGCNNVFAENCEMDSPNLDRVLRIKTNTCRGGIVENIYMRNIKVGQCGESLMRINLNYEPKETAPRGHYPTVRNVYMSNVTCEKSRYAFRFDGLEDRSNIYNINIKDCKFNGVWDKEIEKTGKSHDIHFDNVFVNGSLVLTDKPFKHYSEWLVASEMKRVPQPYMLDYAKKPKWGYVQGLEMESMLDTYITYKNDDVLTYLKQFTDYMIDEKGNATGYSYDAFNLDNIRPARFVYRYNQLFPEKKLNKALKVFFKQLENQPRTNAGVWWHKAIYANQVWLDGIFMGLPFYTLSAPTIKKGKQMKYYDDAFNQISKTFELTYDEKTGLWKHAWDETHSIFWANPETGLSQHSWARAMGWFTMAMVEILDALPEDYAKRPELVKMFQKAMDAVVKYQDKDSKVWYDVLDVKDPRNYLESTASSMFTYCMLKGARMGYLPEKYREKGIEAYKALIKNFIRVDADKSLSITKCCSVSGLGPETNKKRDGSFEYYMSEPVRDNDGKAVGPFVWASLEMERMGYDTSSICK